MTATDKPVIGADTNGDPATVGGGITRLNATDGLFLRAEHLIAMQDYARELAFAAGLANGTGVVYGFTVSLSGDTLEVAPGLAVDPIGRPLRSRKTAVISLLDAPDVGPDGFWVLEVTPAKWLYGTENVYGNLCDDPCNGSAIAPWEAEGITVQLRPDTISGLGVQISAERRNWLAFQYFERERQRGGPWLTPAQPGGVISSITGRDWSEGTPGPATAGVPIAVVQQIPDKVDNWVLDVWTARRDVGDPPARRSWQWRLAMRPWDVFLAQVLQFQAQLAAAASGAVQAEYVDPRSDLIGDLDEIVQRMAVKSKQLRAVVEALTKTTPAMASGGQSLRDQGFVELPPAGFLQVRREDLRSSVEALFGENVDVRICHCRADYVPNAIEQSQHLDRIPLDPSDPKPQVDVLVPDWPADLEALKVDDYGWIAFVRREEVHCDYERPVDHVDVYLVNRSFDSDVLEQDKDLNVPPEATPLGTLTYPADTWAYPGGEVVENIRFNQFPGITLVALTFDDDRRPLASLRASLFAASFDRGIAAPEVYAVASPNAKQEAIIIFQINLG